MKSPPNFSGSGDIYNINAISNTGCTHCALHEMCESCYESHERKVVQPSEAECKEKIEALSQNPGETWTSTGYQRMVSTFISLSKPSIKRFNLSRDQYAINTDKGEHMILTVSLVKTCEICLDDECQGGEFCFEIMKKTT